MIVRRFFFAGVIAQACKSLCPKSNARLRANLERA
jgi:hypothetical protein